MKRLYSTKFWLKTLIFGLGSVFVFWVVAQSFLMWALQRSHLQNALNTAFHSSEYDIVFSEKINRSWFPSLNVSLYDLAIKHRSNHRSIFKAKRVNIRLARSFLWGNIKISKLTFANADLQLNQPKEGFWNFKNQLFNQKNQLPNRIVFDNAHIVIKNHDNQKIWQLNNLSFDYNGLNYQGNINFNGQLKYQNHSPIHIYFQAKSQRYANHIIWSDIHSYGDVVLPTIGQTKWQATGELKWQPDLQQINGYRFKIEGQSNWQNLNFSLHSDTWQINPQRISSDALLLIAHAGKNNHSWDNRLEINKLSSDGNIYLADNLQIESVQKSQNGIWVSHLHGVPYFSLKNHQWQLNQALFNSRQTDLEGRNPKWQTDLNGQINSQENQSFQAQLQGTFDNQTASISLQHLGNKKYQAKIAIKQLNLNPYYSHDARKPETLFNDFFATQEKWAQSLADYQLELNSDIKEILLANLKIENVHTHLISNKHGLAWEDFSANIYNGNLSGSLKVAYTQPRRYRLNAQLTQIDIASLLADWPLYPYASGKAGAEINLQFQGNDPLSLRQSVRGKSSAWITQGQLNDIDLLAWLEDINKKSSASPRVLAHSSLPFHYLGLSTRWIEGVGYSSDLTLLAHNISASGQGKISLPKQKMDYNLSIIGSLDNQGKKQAINLPLRITGSLDHLNIALDYVAVNNSSQQDKEKTIRHLLKRKWQLLQN